MGLPAGWLWAGEDATLKPMGQLGIKGFMGFLVGAVLLGVGPLSASEKGVEIAAASVAKKSTKTATKTRPSFFRTTETPSSNMKPFKKWVGALNRYSKEAADAKKMPCKGKKMNTCYYDKWTQFLISIKSKPKAEQVKAVNNFMNKAPYITDDKNWGKKDYWSSPGEFMARFGDCEDYAIAKFLSLRRLGFNSNDLRVVAVKDMNLKVGHAILIVYMDGKPMVLDNQIKQVIAAGKIRHYKPIFSINTQFWWRHRPA